VSGHDRHTAGHEIAKDDRMKRKIVIAASWLLAAASQAQTLGAALEQAWSRHPQALAFSAREAEVQARLDVAAGLTPTPPALSLSNVSDRFNANVGENAWELELAVPLWLPGQRAAHAQEAGRAADELTARRRALRLQLAGELREAWWALDTARQTLALATQREAAARALEADVVRRFKLGELARVDANLAQNERLAAEAETLEAESARRLAEQTYRTLTGSEAPAQLTAETAAARPEAGVDHPQLAAAQTLAQLAQARLKVAEQTRRDAPELALRLERERGDFNAPYTQLVGIKLTMPFSSGPRVRQDTSAAQAESLQAEGELALAQQRLTLEAERARWALDVAQQQLDKAQERQRVTADSLRLAEKAFALGESDLSTLLRARLALREADVFFNRQHSARLAGVSRLNQSLGVMP
jgi:cobalt-zinc-cadmium efflux system outer membrane protein